MMSYGNSLRQFLYVIPLEHLDLAPQFWAEEDGNNRVRARYIGYSAIFIVMVLGVLDVQAIENRDSALMVSYVMLASNFVIALNEQAWLRRFPIYPLFAVCMVVNVIGAAQIAIIAEGATQLSLALSIINIALLVVPGWTIWYLLPAVPLSLSYFYVTQTLNLLEFGVDSFIHINIVFVLGPLFIALFNRTAVQQRWEAFWTKHVVQEQKSTLEDLNQQLERRNEELDAFAHTVAHDLKNPLTLVVGYAEIVADEMEAEADDRWLEFVHNIVQAGRKSNTIIQELLLLAAVRKEDIVLSPLQMDVVVGQALERLSHHLEEDQVVLVQPEQWPMVMGYAGWVEEVWVNYISNGIKYGGRPCHVELGATRMPNVMIRFWVKDNGKGLSPEAQAVLFTEFTRLDKAQGQGHGLGLSIVRRIVEKLNGRVGIESTVGEGSTFYFELPIKG